MKNKILVVEDDKWFREYLEKIISAEGHEVESASNAYEAIDKIDKILPDVIVLDILLPGSNGVALLNELSSYSDTRVVPVIICSAVSESIPKKNLERYGIKKVLDKTTMDPGDLLISIRNLLK